MFTGSRQVRSLLAAAVLVLLGACGSAERAASPTPARSATPRAAASPTVVASSPVTSNSGYAELPQSKTEEGYYVLGEPSAPIVLTHYSDFL